MTSKSQVPLEALAFIQRHTQSGKIAEERFARGGFRSVYLLTLDEKPGTYFAAKEFKDEGYNFPRYNKQYSDLTLEEKTTVVVSAPAPGSGLASTIGSGLSSFVLLRMVRCLPLRRSGWIPAAQLCVGVCVCVFFCERTSLFRTESTVKEYHH